MRLTETDGVEEATRICLRCSGSLLGGTISSTGALVFSTPPTGFLSIGRSSPVEATCCEDCGEISLRVSIRERFGAKRLRSSEEKL